jgi:hypothetical protein
VNELKKICAFARTNLKMSEPINAHHKPLTSTLGVPCSGRRVACDLVTHHISLITSSELLQSHFLLFSSYFLLSASAGKIQKYILRAQRPAIALQ